MSVVQWEWEEWKKEIEQKSTEVLPRAFKLSEKEGGGTSLISLK